MKTEEKGTPFTFKCARCGECCREHGFVFFRRDDIRRAAAHLGMTQAAFTARYLIKTSDGWAVTVTARRPCVFLSESGCTINDAKPEQCSTFPYWKEYIDADGLLVNFDRPCPGIKLKKTAAKEKTSR